MSNGKSGVGKVRGLIALVRDGVEHGSRAIEGVQKKVTDRPFMILEKIPGIEAPAKVVHIAIDGVVAITHVGIRTVNHAASVAIDAGLSVFDHPDDASEKDRDRSE